MRYMDYCKRTVPMHDDIYDFFLQELPGYDDVGLQDGPRLLGRRRPRRAPLRLPRHDGLGRTRYVTPGIVLDGELIDRPRRDQPRDPDPARLELLRRLDNEETFVTQDPLGNPVDKRHPWNKVTLPKPQARDFNDKYSWVVSPRIYDKRTDTYVALRHRRRPVRAPVGDREGRPRRAPRPEGDRQLAADDAAQDRLHARDGPRVEDPGEVQRDRARPRAPTTRRSRRSWPSTTWRRR